MSSNQVNRVDSNPPVIPKSSKIDLAKVRADMDEIRSVRSTIRWLDENRGEVRRDLSELCKALDRARELLPTVPTVVANLRAGMQPANKATITKAIAILVGCFPNAEGKDLTVYGSVLVEDLAEMRVSTIQLDAAFTKLRRTRKFLPSFSEVIEAIQETETFESHLDACNKLAATIEVGEAAKLRLEEHLATSMQSRLREPRTLADCARLCSVSDFDPHSPKPELDESELKVAKIMANELMAGTYNRTSSLKLRAAALHLVHEKLRGAATWG